jgi:hypothetical protein
MPTSVGLVASEGVHSVCRHVRSGQWRCVVLEASFGARAPAISEVFALVAVVVQFCCPMGVSGHHLALVPAVVSQRHDLCAIAYLTACATT